MKTENKNSNCCNLVLLRWPLHFWIYINFALVVYFRNLHYWCSDSICNQVTNVTSKLLFDNKKKTNCLNYYCDKLNYTYLMHLYHTNQSIRNVPFFQSLIPIDQFHQSKQFLSSFQNLITTDASSMNWLHSNALICAF
jgi:hypothetical protein